jgi:hypothetical protein
MLKKLLKEETHLPKDVIHRIVNPKVSQSKIYSREELVRGFFLKNLSASVMIYF